MLLCILQQDCINK